VRGKQLAALGVQRLSRVAGVSDGRPRLEDGRLLDVANVIWCTGFDPGFTWIDLPVFGPDRELLHDAGVATEVPGLYFVGLGFLFAMSSSMIHGVGRDAGRIVDAISARARPEAKSSSEFRLVQRPTSRIDGALGPRTAAERIRQP
jgi:putative flavoprotein involved in K+ transport